MMMKEKKLFIKDLLITIVICGVILLLLFGVSCFIFIHGDYLLNKVNHKFSSENIDRLIVMQNEGLVFALKTMAVLMFIASIFAVIGFGSAYFKSCLAESKEFLSERKAEVAQIEPR
jgi:ABC-type phosphate transport system permease subunit